jgi:hypothetical protein
MFSVILWTGLLLSILCILGWSRLLWLDIGNGVNVNRNADSTSTGNMFKYLLVKAVCDLLFFIDYTYGRSAYYNDLRLMIPYYKTFYGIYLHLFALFYLCFLSSSMELLATLGKFEPIPGSKSITNFLYDCVYSF